jgi:hypothetical protein
MLKKISLVLFVISSGLQLDCEVVANTTLINCYQKCRMLYNGSKNFYNQTSGLCEIVKQCSDIQQYDYLTNTCSPFVQDFTGFPSATSNGTTSASLQLGDSDKLILVNFSNFLAAGN